MVLILLFIVSIILLIISLKKTFQLQTEILKIQNRMGMLKDNIDINRQYLRKKLNRNLHLQKQLDNELIPLITYQKLGKTIQALLPSDTVYTLADDEGFGLSGTCEGNGDCGLCAMLVITGEQNLTPISEVEQEVLNKSDYPQGTRLSCQARVLGNITVNFINPEDEV